MKNINIATVLLLFLLLSPQAINAQCVYCDTFSSLGQSAVVNKKKKVIKNINTQKIEIDKKEDTKSSPVLIKQQNEVLSGRQASILKYILSGGSAPDYLGDMAYRTEQLSSYLNRYYTSIHDLVIVSRSVNSQGWPSTVAELSELRSRLGRAIYWYEKRSGELNNQKALFYEAFAESKLSQADKADIQKSVEIALFQEQSANYFLKSITSPAYVLRRWQQRLDIVARPFSYDKTSKVYTFSSALDKDRHEELVASLDAYGGTRKALLEKVSLVRDMSPIFADKILHLAGVE
jgi:hypothetical protein